MKLHLTIEGMYWCKYVLSFLDTNHYNYMIKIRALEVMYCLVGSALLRKATCKGIDVG